LGLGFFGLGWVLVGLGLFGLGWVLLELGLLRAVFGWFGLGFFRVLLQLLLLYIHATHIIQYYYHYHIQLNMEENVGCFTFAFCQGSLKV